MLFFAMSNNRRTFIKNNLLLGLSAPLLTRVAIPGAAAASGQGSPYTLGGLSRLRDQYRTALFDQFLPNMDSYVVDHEYGGFLLQVDCATGELLGTDKRSWFDGRGLWVYSYLYNNFEKNPKYLEIAGKTKDLLLSLRPEGDAFWVKTYSREGKPLDGPGDIYGNLFVAEGLAEYAIAAGEPQYRELAKQLIFSCVDRYDRPDYSYVVGSVGLPPIEAPRILGHWMIFLSLSTQMLKHGADADLEALANRSVNAIMDHHINREHGLTNEVINHDLSTPVNGYDQFSVIGHGFETLMFVMREAERRKDDALFERASAAFKRHVEIAEDWVYGGYFHTVKNVAAYTWILDKQLWTSMEVLNGTLMLVERSGDPWAWETYMRTLNYVEEKIIQDGYKFWPSYADRKAAVLRTKSMENYHEPRQLMFGLQSLERMIQKQDTQGGAA